MIDAPSGRASRLAENSAIFLLLLHLSLRFSIPSSAETSTNLFVHSLPWISAALWFLSRATQPSWNYRWTGLELPFFLWVVLCLLSVLPASHRRGALEHAFVFTTLPLLFCGIATAIGSARRVLPVAFLFSAALPLSLYALAQRFWLYPELRNSPETGALASPEILVRLEAGEPPSTFLYPNTFAGFLVLLLPILLGSLRDGRQTQSPLRYRGLKAALAVVVALLLYWTGSTGGWFAGIAALLLLTLLLRLPRTAPFRRALPALMLGAGFLSILVTFLAPSHFPRLLQWNESLQIRSLYWEAAARITADHPLRGVGLDNFQEYYPGYKSDGQQEVRKVHNDYLQVLVELGLPGLLILLGILFFFYRAAFLPNIEAPRETPEALPRGWIPALPLGILLAYVLEGSFEDAGGTPLLALLLASISALAFPYIFRQEHRVLSHTNDGLGAGAAAGLFGLTLHSLVEFNLFDFSVASALYLVAGLLLLLHRREILVPLGRRLALAGSILFLLTIVPILLVVPPLQNIEGARGEAEELLRRGEASAAADLLDSQPDSPLPEERTLELRARIERTLAVVRREPSRLSRAVALLERAVELRPRSAGLRYDLAQLHLELWKSALTAAREQGDRSGKIRSEAQSHFSQAEVVLESAVKLYPTLALHRFARGSLRRNRGAEEEARLEFREALRLSALAREGHLKLPPALEALALLHLGRDGEAVEAIVRSSPPPTEEGMQRLRDSAGVWYDPILEETLKAALLRIRSGS